MGEHERGTQSTPTRRPLPWWLQGIAALGAAAAISAFLPAGDPWLGRGMAALGLAESAAQAEPDQGRRGRRGGDRAAPPVILAEAEAARDDLRLELVGGGLAKRSAVLRPRAQGRVTAVLFEAGDAIKAGQALLRLEDVRERLALERAEATLGEAIRRRERAARLNRSGSGSEAAFDAAKTEAELARIARDEAKEALEDRTVAAPFAGVVSLPLVEIGDRITENSDIATLDDRSSLLVEAAAPETAFGRLRLAMPISARTVAYPGESFAGRLSEIDSRLDRDDRTVTLRAEIPNAEDRLRPGMSFVLSLSAPGEPAVATPELALQWERSGSYVWRVREDRAERVAVRLVARDAGRALLQDAGEATDPLQAGDKVVVEGVQRLRDGARVRVLRDDEAEGGGDAAERLAGAVQEAAR